MEIAKINLLTEKVRYCLEKYPETRNDDALLTLRIIQAYLPEDVHLIAVPDSPKPVAFVRYRALMRVREDNVKRIRAKIQNEEGLFLPTDPKVREKRKINEEAWLKWARNQAEEV